MYKIIGGDRKEYGPVSADEVRHWISEGRLNGQSMAWLEGGNSGWQTLASFAEFAEALRAQMGSAVPPPGMPMPPVSAEMWTAQILARNPRIQPMECLSLSWKLLTANFGLLFTASFLIWLIGTLSGFLPFGGLLYGALKGVFYGGLYLVFLNRIRGNAAAVPDVFSGFKIAFVPLALAGLLSSLLSSLSACCFIIPGAYLFVAWIFSVPLVADRRLDFWPAMELSRKVVTRVWFEVFALLLLAFIPSILTFLFVEVKVSVSMFSLLRDMMEAGRPDFRRIMSSAYEIARKNLGLFLVFKLMVLLNLPFAVGALMYAYESLFGTRTERNS
jgi:hypothetical protein